MPHDEDGLRLKAALLRVPWVGVMSIPLHIGAAAATSKKDARKG